jgi:poly(beta-D-mannuronate) lyase
MEKINLFATILFMSALLTAKEYRVSTPSDFTSALASVKAGDTITIINGTYSNWTITFNASGTQTAPILVRAETVGGVTLTGSSTIKFGGSYIVVDGFLFSNGYVPQDGVVEFRTATTNYANHCRLTNTSIIDYSNPDTTIDSKYVSIYGQYNRVDHCYLKGKKNLGTTLVVWRPDTSANYALIDSNYFGPRPPLGLNGGETIRIGTSDLCTSNSFSVVEHNYFDQCNGELEIISSKSCGNIFRYNTFVNCIGTLTLREAHRNAVYNNFFFGDKVSNAGAIRIIGEDHVVYNNYITGMAGTNYRTAIAMMNGIPNSPNAGYFQVKRAVVAFNTLVDNAHSFNIGVASDSTCTLTPVDCVFANNIIYGTKTPLVAFPTTMPANMTWKGNIFYGTSTGFTTLPDSNYVVDPKLLTADDTGIRHLSATSPAINAAIGIFDSVLVDMDGQVRDSKKDIGADEYSNAIKIFIPLKPSDVGPKTSPAAVTEKQSGAAGFELQQNFPNPFNPSTTIRYSIPAEGPVTLKIFDTVGDEAVCLVNEEQSAGMYSVRLNTNKLASGVYFSVLTFNNSTLTKKMVIVK